VFHNHELFAALLIRTPLTNQHAAHFHYIAATGMYADADIGCAVEKNGHSWLQFITVMWRFPTLGILKRLRFHARLQYIRRRNTDTRS
jgi:hypothetical protein